MASDGKKVTRASYKLQEARIAVERRGRGKPILLIPGEEVYEPDLALIDDLAKKHEVIIAWPPGYGRSTRPDSIRNLEDASYLYLDLLDKLALKNVTIMGFSTGGWIAAEMATKNTARIGKMVLTSPFGIKPGGKFDRDIADIYFLKAEEVKKRKWHDPANDPRDFGKLSNKALFDVARHREMTAKMCWDPYFHNVSLKYRLNRIDVPTLLVWGASDRIVTTDYGKAYTKLIPGAKMTTIRNAGHLPHVERPDAFLKAVSGFIG
jgi:pimeloyl-ACP methyl ester carboxylesterase